MTFSGARIPRYFRQDRSLVIPNFIFLILSTGALAIIYRNANPNSLILFRDEFGFL